MNSILSKLLICAALISTTNSACIPNHPLESDDSFPNLNGKLVYHSYSTYGDGTSQLFLYDFASKTLTQLSNPTWGIIDPMNAVFSRDGRWVMFMVMKNSAWNIFFYELGSSNSPIDVTQSHGETRNEDPKFSYDGKYVFFKQDGDVMRADLTFENGLPSFTNVADVTGTGSTIENSMPYPSPDGEKVYFTTKIGDVQNLFQISLTTKVKEFFEAPQNLNAYYPIVRSDGTVFYSRWRDPKSQMDQIYTKVSSKEEPIELSTNDCDSNNSDPAPVDDTNLVFFSSTQHGDIYELYLGDITTGKRWSLDQFGVNADKTKNKLGASYFGGVEGQEHEVVLHGRAASVMANYEAENNKPQN